MDSSFSTFPLADIKGFNPLVSDYLKEKSELNKLYKYEVSLNSFETIIKDKSKNLTNRKVLVDTLLGQYANIPTSTLVTQNIHSLLNENTFTITAAHQPCLFMGPLFNIYKIAGTINLANQLKAAYPAYNFVPVFWMGSEDHDWEELNHTFVHGHKITWQQENLGGAIGRIPTDTLQASFEELEKIIGKNNWLEKIQQAVVKYKTFGKLTHFLVDEIFQEQGLVVIDQDDASLKALFQTVMADEILKEKAIDLLKENLDFLSKEYKVQANPRAINFFYLSENSRARIVRNEHGFEVRNTSIKFSEEEMMLEIQNHPENFSPNVILRPLFQETILPNLAFVGGAGELSYWLQLKPIFEYYQINFPALVMRNSMTQINAATERKLSKLKLTPELFFGDIDKLIADFTKANVTSEISLQTEKEKLNSIMDTVAEKVTAIDASLLNNVAAEKQKMQNTLENLEAKLLKAEKRKQEESINQIKAIQAHILPNGNWQERVESFLPNYIEGGKEYIQSMVDLANPFLKAMLFLSPDHTSKP